METRDERALEHLRQLGERPAVPFHEEGPALYLRERLDSIGLSTMQDNFGTIVAHYQNGSPNHVPPLALIAHMDHPGFEVTNISRGQTIATALGAVPIASLHKPTHVLVLTENGDHIAAETQPFGKDGDRTVKLKTASSSRIAKGMPVVFDLPGFKLDGATIRMRAADDLAGCAAILTALERMVDTNAQANVYGVFTRAEEGGLYGARLMAEAKTLPLDTFIVSIESSSVIPGVAQGDGPVIRTGDALCTFNSEAEQVFHVAAHTLRQRYSDFKVQRQLMSAGGCEATAFAMFGYKVTGLAFPLGNWHNATTSIQDPCGGIDAEYIALSDFLGGVDLLEEASKSVAVRNASPLLERIGSVPDDVRRRMENGFGD